MHLRASDQLVHSVYKSIQLNTAYFWGRNRVEMLFWRHFRPDFDPQKSAQTPAFFSLLQPHDLRGCKKGRFLGVFWGPPHPNLRSTRWSPPKHGAKLGCASTGPCISGRNSKRGFYWPVEVSVYPPLTRGRGRSKQRVFIFSFDEKLVFGGSFFGPATPKWRFFGPNLKNGGRF